MAHETASLTQDSKLMARILNSNFISIFTVDNIETIPEGPIPLRGITLLKISTISDQNVKTNLDKLDMNKSKGPENLSLCLPKE